MPNPTPEAPATKPVPTTETGDTLARRGVQPTGRGRRILLILTSAGVGGAGRVVQSQVRGLTGEGYRPLAVIPAIDPEAAAETLAWFEAEGVPAEAHPEVPAWYSARSPKDLLRFAAFIRRRADIAYLHYGNSYISLKDVVAARLSGRECYVMVHHAAPLVNARLARMTVWASRLTHRVIVTTPAMEQLLVGAGVKPSKIEVIPLAVPAPPALPDRADARTRLGVPHDAFVVASVARLDAGKNVDTVVNAVAGLSSDGPPAHVVVAGTGETLEHVRSLAAERLGERGHILGFVPDLADVYAAADVFALPSNEEGFGLVYVEAAHYGVPAIGSDVGGVRHAILEGETGLLVPPADVEALRAALEQLRRDPERCREMGLRAQRRAQQEFREETMAARHTAVFER
ncbi:MAG: glycosyltransferase [Dehalococcoidia bacterium]|nr:glycosyltransferase [Dehalococcoidia bacterium]